MPGGRRPILRCRRLPAKVRPLRGGGHLMAFRIADAIESFFREDFQDGDLVSWDWLTYHLHITPKAQAENQFLMLERVDDFRNELLKEHLIALQNVRGKGYRIVPPAEQAEYAAREL